MIWRRAFDLGLNQSQLATRAGFSKAAVSHWVRGEYSPTTRAACLLAEAVDARLLVVPNEGPRGVELRIPDDVASYVSLPPDLAERVGMTLVAAAHRIRKT